MSRQLHRHRYHKNEAISISAVKNVSELLANISREWGKTSSYVGAGAERWRGELQDVNIHEVSSAWKYVCSPGALLGLRRRRRRGGGNILWLQLFRGINSLQAAVGLWQSPHRPVMVCEPWPLSLSSDFQQARTRWADRTECSHLPALQRTQK